MQSQVDRRYRALHRGAAFVDDLQVPPQVGFRLQRAPAGVGRIVRLEDRQDAVADQFQHVAAGIVDRGYHGFGVIVQQGNDLTGSGVIADPGIAAQVREPQDRADLVGDLGKYGR